MDFAGFDGRTRQFRQWNHGALGSAHCDWIRYLPDHPSPSGVSLAGEGHRQYRNGTANCAHDDSHDGCRFRFSLLHGRHRNPRYLRELPMSVHVA